MVDTYIGRYLGIVVGRVHQGLHTMTDPPPAGPLLCVCLSVAYVT